MRQVGEQQVGEQQVEVAVCVCERERGREGRGEGVCDDSPYLPSHAYLRVYRWFC